MGKKIIILICTICLQASTYLQAQISHGGRPLPLAMTRSTQEEMFVDLPAFDISEQLRLDSLEESDLRSGYRFAYKFMTDYTPENSGIRFTTQDGTSVWRLGIRSANALSLNLMFTEYELPEGASLYLYNRDQTQIIGSFNHLNNSRRSILPVSPIEGDELIIEYQEPANAGFHGKLTVGEVNHGYRNFKQSSPQPDQDDFNCIPALACYQDTTDGYNDIGRSVVLLIINGITGCTGTLVNNTANDKKPYILTASHCLNNQFTIKNPDYEEIAGTVVCFFNYNSPNCSPVEMGPTDQSVASAHYRAVNEKTDMALLELQDMPPADYQPYYAGWNASDAGFPPYAGIHHPSGSPKRLNLSLENCELSTYPYYQILGFDRNAHWKVKRWVSGCTAGGSSGSPLFDKDNLVVGGLTGGFSDCANPVNDYYYALKYSWAPSEEKNKQLKYWLDPLNLDRLVCNGLDPRSSETDLEQIYFREGTSIAVDKEQKTLFINLRGPIRQAGLSIISMEGKTLRKWKIENEQTTIPLGSIPPGVYIVQVTSDNKLYTQKIIF